MIALLPATMAFADFDKPVSFEQLPATAKQFIKTHFPEAKITLATVDRGLFTTWDVIFRDGTQIEFDSRGQWKEIDCRGSFVPESVLHPRIVSFLREHYPDARVRDVERDSRRVEVNLNNRLELTFDSQGNLREYDD